MEDFKKDFCLYFEEEIDDNSMRLFLDDTVELDDLVKEIKKDE